MAAGEIATLAGTIVEIASTIQETGNNWYRASAEWTDFPRKVDTLRRKHDFWRDEITKHGMLTDALLMEPLRHAKAALEEELKLSNRQGQCGAGCWPKLSTTIFPAQVGLRMQAVIDAFDAIPGQLKMEDEAAILLQNRVLRKPPSLAIREDDRFVPLKASQSRIRSALDGSQASPDGARVVLLHGLPGKGKTTLARHTALHHRNAAAAPALFERVVILECGPKADPLTKQFDLLQLLGPNTAALDEHVKAQTSSAVAIRGRLCSLLKHQRILIVLDDIWEGEFLQRMVDLCGVGVKCLVTSQRADLCQGLSFPSTRIQIEDVQEEVATEILASHVGFQDKLIPAHIQGVAKKMVELTEGNPLALASVAIAIDSNRSDELEEWEAAAQNFLHLLSCDDTAYVFGKKYSKSFWSATKLSVQSLKEDVQKLLILVHLCAGPSVPEEVLQVLYRRSVFQAGSTTFERARRELQNRELIKISKLDERKQWSVHSLQKLFIDDEVRDLKKSVFTLLAPTPDSTEI